MLTLLLVATSAIVVIFMVYLTFQYRSSSPILFVLCYGIIQGLIVAILLAFNIVTSQGLAENGPLKVIGMIINIVCVIHLYSLMNLLSLENEREVAREREAFVASKRQEDILKALESRTR